MKALKFFGRVLILWLGFMLALGIIALIGIGLNVLFAPLPEPHRLIAIGAATVLFFAVVVAALFNVKVDLEIK